MPAREFVEGLDYADQRYFAGLSGRFLSSDPYEASGGASDPGSWNRYPYVGGDPVNFLDRTGLASCPAGSTMHYVLGNRRGSDPPSILPEANTLPSAILEPPLGGRGRGITGTRG